MNRKELLEKKVSKEENVSLVVEAILNKDAKFLKRAKSKLEEEIEDLEDKIKERLSNIEIPLDKSTIEVSYLELINVKETLALYKAFEKDFIK